MFMSAMQKLNVTASRADPASLPTRSKMWHYSLSLLCGLRKDHRHSTSFQHGVQ